MEIQMHDKTGVINDPLGQTHSLASSEHYFLCLVLLHLKVGTYVRTTCVKTMIVTVGCGSKGAIDCKKEIVVI